MIRIYIKQNVFLERIMQGKKEINTKFFYDVTLEKLVPQSHIIRKIDKILDLAVS